MSEEKVLATYFGENDEIKFDFANEEEKGLFWFYDDLHCPNPLSPLYFDCNGWWGPTCEYMYRRFGAPIGSEWLGKRVGTYLYTAVVPPKVKPEQAGSLFQYYGTLMPIYAEKFYEIWENEYVPEIKGYWKKILDFDFEEGTIPEALIHMEDCLDMQERAFKIHWIINLAQFQASTDFVNYYAELMGEVDDEVGKINVSTDDRNWDSLHELWKMKEFVKADADLAKLFKENERPVVMEKLPETEAGKKFLEMLDEYKNEYGFHALYTHEYIYKTVYEDPSPIIDVLKDYLATDYSFPEQYEACKREQDEAIANLYAKIDDPEKLEKMRHYLHLCVQMAPITPDHHFYLDQGIFSHMRVMFLGIGKMYVKAGIIDDPEDIFMLGYEDVRCAGVDPNYPAREIVAKNRAEMEAAKNRSPREWYGTATQWQVYEEPYKTLWGYPQRFEAEQAEAAAAAEAEKADSKVLKGIPGYPGVYEGRARYITEPKDLDDVKKGEVLVCKMTNPAWVVCFSQIGALVTDTGGALSHPAVVSREFGIPCVVGTRKATQMIKTGDLVRVDGTTGTVEVIPEEKPVLKGIPGYPGVYEGTARYITEPKDLDDVKKGEVLVCKMTNPAWVVCFSQIGALVTDTGGALSHPAVVSREFGIPCVVGTRKATQMIKTGDLVRVDGTTGTVEVIPEEKPVLKGIPGYPGVYEGTARYITEPKDLDDVKKGEVLVCKMTNPAWVVCFSQIGALVTDTGGALSHPAVVSREFGIPCVVGTRKATQVIKTGDKVRVDGTTGTVEVIG